MCERVLGPGVDGISSADSECTVTGLFGLLAVSHPGMLEEARMNEPICKLWLMKPKPGWYRLSKEEQDTLQEKLVAAIGEVGGKLVVACQSSWSSEQWAWFGIEEYPSIEAAQKHDALLAELHWPYEFVDSFSILGTKSE